MVKRYCEGDNLFHETDRGVIFTLTFTELSDAYDNDQPFPMRKMGGRPLGAVELSIERDSPTTRAVVCWESEIEQHLGILAAELDDIRNTHVPIHPSTAGPMGLLRAVRAAAAAAAAAIVAVVRPRQGPE